MAGVARKGGAWLAAPGPRIKDLTLEELCRYDIGHPQPGSGYALKHPMVRALDAVVPTLAEIVALAAPSFRLMVELKCDASDDSADPATLAEATYTVAGNDVIYVGFDWRALVPLVKRGAICWFTTDKLQGDARPVIDAIAQSGGQGWFPNFPDATPNNVAYARARGLKVGAWTVNDPADMRRLQNLDAICTDRPDLLQAFE
jgi:glycerophosphoryl diester phosphodiesterase